MKTLKNRHMSKKLDIISLFISDYNKRLTGREVGRILDINHQTAFNHLNQLVKANVLNYERKGRNKEFSLISENYVSKIFIQMAEQKKSLDFISSNKNIASIIYDLKDFVETIIVFGSYAEYKSTRDSDLDIVILGKYDKNKLKKYKDRVNIKINEHVVTYSQFNKIFKNKNPLSIEIFKKHIIFGDVYKVLEVFLND